MIDVKQNFVYTYLPNQFIKYILLFVLCGCSFNKSLSTISENLVLDISTSTNTVKLNNPVLKLQVKIKNTSDKNVFVLDRNDLGNTSLFTYQIAIYNNNKLFYIQESLIKRKIPNKHDYIKIIAGDSVSKQFEIDFSKLYSKASEILNSNKKYGNYSIQIIYNDSYNKHHNSALQLASNIIDVNYNY
jgi:hypothetical protein